MFKSINRKFQFCGSNAATVKRPSGGVVAFTPASFIASFTFQKLNAENSGYTSRYLIMSSGEFIWVFSRMFSEFASG